MKDNMKDNMKVKVFYVLNDVRQKIAGPFVNKANAVDLACRMAAVHESYFEVIEEDI